MKKVFVIIFMLTSAVSFNQVAKAEDGSLKIDAETKKIIKLRIIILNRRLSYLNYLMMR